MVVVVIVSHNNDVTIQYRFNYVNHVKKKIIFPDDYNISLYISLYIADQNTNNQTRETDTRNN